jgi:hypothetical protein
MPSTSKSKTAVSKTFFLKTKLVSCNSSVSLVTTNWISGLDPPHDDKFVSSRPPPYRVMEPLWHKYANSAVYTKAKRLFRDGDLSPLFRPAVKHAWRYRFHSPYVSTVSCLIKRSDCCKNKVTDCFDLSNHKRKQLLRKILHCCGDEPVCWRRTTTWTP